MRTDREENHPASDLAYLVQGSACYLVNTGDTDIAEVEYDSSFVGFEGGGVVCVEYGRWRLRGFPARSCLAVHRMTQEDIMYLPMRSGWFQLDVHRVVTADGAAMTTPCMLKATEKWGGFAFPEAFLERTLERVEPVESNQERTTR
jgi:hypothetical protein